MTKNVNIKISAEAGDINKVVDQVSSQLSRLETKINGTSKGAGAGFGAMATKASAMGNVIANVMASVGNAINNSMGDAVSRLDALNNYPKVMSNLGIGADEAQASMNRLNEKLLGLPTALDDAVMAVQRFSSANQNVGASTEMFLALNNAILAGGASTQIQQSALEQLSQAYSKGKPDMMEWRTAMTAMPAQLMQVAKAMGFVNATELGSALTEGKISMQELMNQMVLMNNQGINGFKSFDEQARNSTGGVGTSIINLKTAITRGIAEVMNAIGQSNISGFFNSIANAIGAVIPYVVVFVKIVMSAVSLISNALGGLFGKSSKQAGDTAKSTQATSNALKGASAGAGGVAGSLADGAKSAKKINQQLAGFDEMNTLKEQSDSGGGAGVGGGGADLSGIDVGDMDLGEGKLSKVAELWKKVTDWAKKAWEVIKNVAKWLWDLLPQPVQNALKAFGELLLSIFQNPAVQLFLGVFAGVAVVVGIIVGLFTVLAPVLSVIGGVLGTIFSPVVLIIAAVVAAIVVMIVYWEDIKRVAIAVGKAIADWWGAFIGWIKSTVIDPIANFFKGLWDGIIKGLEFITKPFVVAFEIWWAIVSKVIEILMKVVEIFTVLLAFAIQWVWNNVIKPIWGGMVDFFKGVWDGVVKIFSPVAEWFGGIFKGAWEKVKSAFSAVASFFRGVWDTIVSIFTSVGTAIGNAVGGAVKTVVNSILSFAENSINGFIRAINTAISVINKLPGVSISKISELRIPRLARGGIVDSGQIFMAGEAGKEAIVPLENNTGWLDMIAERLGSAGGGQLGSVVVKIGEETIANKVIELINDRSQMSGLNTITV